MTNTVSIDSVKEALTCPICQDIVTLPVHAMCCEKAKSLAPGCLSCVRTYYELNKPPIKRTQYKKSWGGCGCDIDLKTRFANANNYYNHTTQLDMVRNLLGPSICFHENCNVQCETAAELRRHITGTSISSDKHGNCQEATTKCKYCNLYGKRSFIEGEHYNKYHAYITCDICSLQIRLTELRVHYNYHKEQMQNLRKKVHDYENSA